MHRSPSAKVWELHSQISSQGVALQSKNSILTTKNFIRFHTSSYVRRTPMKPGDQRLAPQAVVPFCSKNEKTDFWAIFCPFFTVFCLPIPCTSSYPHKIRMARSHDLACQTPKIWAKIGCIRPRNHPRHKPTQTWFWLNLERFLASSSAHLIIFQKYSNHP